MSEVRRLLDLANSSTPPHAGQRCRAWEGQRCIADSKKRKRCRAWEGQRFDGLWGGDDKPGGQAEEVNTQFHGAMIIGRRTKRRQGVDAVNESCGSGSAGDGGKGGDGGDGTLYSTLGVLPSAPKQEIKKAYLRQCFIWHPDKNQDDPNATATFQRVAKAYEVLSNDASRLKYDAELSLRSFGVPEDDEQYIEMVAWALWQAQRVGENACVMGGEDISKSLVRMFVQKQGRVMLQMKRNSGTEFQVFPSGWMLWAGLKEEAEVAADMIAMIVIAS